VWVFVKFSLGLRFLVVVLVDGGRGLRRVQVEGIGLGTGPPAPARTVMGVARARSGRRVRRRVVRCIALRFSARLYFPVGVVGFQERFGETTVDG
jgi:hypothetical protein